MFLEVSTILQQSKYFFIFFLELSSHCKHLQGLVLLGMVAKKKTSSNQSPKSPLSTSPADIVLEGEEEEFLTKLSKGKTLKQTPTSLMLCKGLYLHSWEDDSAKRTFSFVTGVKFFAAYYFDCLAQTKRELKEPSKTEHKRYLDVLDKAYTEPERWEENDLQQPSVKTVNS